MAPRQRKEINSRLRPGMRDRDGYYSYTNPADGIEYGLGRDRQKAIAEVIAVEVTLATRHLSLLDRIAGAGNTWADCCDTFEKKLAERASKPNTVRQRRSQLNRLRRSFDARRSIASVTTKEIAGVVNGIKAEGKHRAAQAFRSFLIDFFDRMVAEGVRTDNPAQVLDAVQVKVRRARLSFEVFIALYERTKIIWLRNAMALAVVSAQPRECVAAAQFVDIKDGEWWNHRGKTDSRVIIPLALKLHCFGMSLEDVVKQCRATGILSRHLVHQTQRAKGATLGKKMHVDKITRVFSAELAALGLDFGDKEPPTFHEIRSLAERLYKAQGNVSTKDLLAHKQEKTTALYDDPRGEWVRVIVR